MKKRGPRGIADKADLKVIEADFGFKRPDAPEELTERQKEIWTQTTRSEPVDFFNTSVLQTLLKAYCCHASEVERLTETINSFQTSWLKNGEGMRRYSEMLKARAKETTALGNVATKLRMTNQSRYTPQAAATASRNTSKGIRPWEE